jgi:hypothetical protein
MFGMKQKMPIISKGILVDTGGPDGRKFQSFCDGIELLPPGIQKSEALTILDYRRKRDLK